MSDLATIRAAIVAKLQGVPGIGLVHDYERFAKSNSDFQTLYTTAGALLGWHVRRVRTVERERGIGTYTTDHLWRIAGFMALVDGAASEKAFDDLVEAIRTAFRADDELGGVVGTCIHEEFAGIRLDDSGPVMFAGVLCHGARMSLLTRVY